MDEYNRPSYSQIFGTPPEPLFNLSGNGVSFEMLQQWLNLLRKKNLESIAESRPEQGAFTVLVSTEYLFMTCEKLNMPPHTKYLAMELFDRFMLKHIKELKHHVRSTRSTNKRKDWLGIQERVRNQVTLRIVSCCQIASKLTSHYRVGDLWPIGAVVRNNSIYWYVILSGKRAQRFLTEAGYRYSPDSILQSELRILKTLNFYVAFPTPLVYLETILELLGHKDPAIEVKQFHSVSQLFLSMVYMRHTEIYKQLHQMASSQSTPSQEDSEKFCSVRMDKFLLTVSVIAASTFVVDQLESDKVISHLNEITSIPIEDIVDFATVIIQFMVDSHEKMQ